MCLAGRGKCQTESRVSLLRQRVRRRGVPREGGWIFAVEGSCFRCIPRAIPPLVCSANIRRMLQTAKRIVPNYHAFNISNPTFFHQFPPRGAPPFRPRPPTPRTLRLLPHLGLFGPPHRFRIFPSAPLLTPTFSTTFKKTNRNCIFNISTRLFSGLDNELIRRFLLSGKGKIGGCSGRGTEGERDGCALCLVGVCSHC